MTVTALISWYEEHPAWLAATVASLAGLCDHVTAVDGAYALYPDAKPRSGAEQHHAIQETCHALGLGCTIHTPVGTFAGNEIEKRTLLFQLGALSGADWFFPIDGDEIVTHCDTAVVRDRLAATDLDVGCVLHYGRDDWLASPERLTLAQAFPHEQVSRQRQRQLFRALPGLRVEGHHAHYTDGTKVLRSVGDVSQRPALDLTDHLHVEHRNAWRPERRRRDSHSYYERRDRLGVESVT